MHEYKDFNFRHYFPCCANLVRIDKRHENKIIIN